MVNDPVGLHTLRVQNSLKYYLLLLLFSLIIWLMRKRYWIAGSLISVVLLLGGLYAFFEFQRTSEINTLKKKEVVATTNYESAAVELIKSDLNLSYVFYENYPIDMGSLSEDLLKIYERDQQKGQEYVTSMKRAMKNLKNFEYSVRGDRKAYKFSYTDLHGEKKEVEGNYEEDFH